MPILIILAALAALALYLWLCSLAFVWITFPAGLIAIGVGAPAGALAALAIVLQHLSGKRGGRIFTPNRVTARRLRLLRTPKALNPDYAWPGYFVIQVWLDAGIVAWNVCRQGAALVTASYRAAWAMGWIGLVRWPVLLPLV